MSESLDPELIALEQTLGRLEPQAQLNRDTVFYQAGRAGGRGRWLWPASTAVSTLVAAILGWLLWHQPPPRPETVLRYVVVEKAVPQPVASEARTPPDIVEEPRDLADSGTAGYLRRRNEVLRWGAEMLPAAPPQPSRSEPLTPVATPRLDPWETIPKASSLPAGDDT
jgi:hypothetical protein